MNFWYDDEYLGLYDNADSIEEFAEQTINLWSWCV